MPTCDNCLSWIETSLKEDIPLEQRIKEIAAIDERTLDIVSAFEMPNNKRKKEETIERAK
jgi:hypothetical protein